MDQVDEEVEALTFTYDGVSWDADTRTLSLPLLPSAEQHDGRVYLRCDLQFDLSDYPRLSPSARLTNAKGLSDCQRAELLALITSMAREATGDHGLLLLLVSSAYEFVESANHPSGECSLCLESMEASAAKNEDVILLPCFHTGCFEAYSAWEQAQRREQAQIVRGKHGAGAAPYLARAGLRAVTLPSGGAFFEMPCPVCRASVSSEDLPPALLRAALAGTRTAAAPAAKASQPIATCLDGATLARVRALQRAQRGTLEAQRAANGLVGNKVAVSLEELEARRAAQIAAAAAARDSEAQVSATKPAPASGSAAKKKPSRRPRRRPGGGAAGQVAGC